ncbi:hypothetical protein D3C85_970610 [compost metagenome]
MARTQSHLVQLTHIPSRQDNPTVVWLVLQHVDDVLQLVNLTTNHRHATVARATGQVVWGQQHTTEFVAFLFQLVSVFTTHDASLFPTTPLVLIDPWEFASDQFLTRDVQCIHSQMRIGEATLRIFPDDDALLQRHRFTHFEAEVTELFSTLLDPRVPDPDLVFFQEADVCIPRDHPDQFDLDAFDPGVLRGDRMDLTHGDVVRVCSPNNRTGIDTGASGIVHTVFHDAQDQLADVIVCCEFRLRCSTFTDCSVGAFEATDGNLSTNQLSGGFWVELERNALVIQFTQQIANLHRVHAVYQTSHVVTFEGEQLYALVEGVEVRLVVISDHLLSSKALLFVWKGHVCSPGYRYPLDADVSAVAVHDLVKHRLLLESDVGLVLVDVAFLQGVEEKLDATQLFGRVVKEADVHRRLVVGLDQDVFKVWEFYVRYHNDGTGVLGTAKVADQTLRFTGFRISQTYKVTQWCNLTKPFDICQQLTNTVWNQRSFNFQHYINLLR